MKNLRIGETQSSNASYPYEGDFRERVNAANSAVDFCRVFSSVKQVERYAKYFGKIVTHNL